MRPAAPVQKMVNANEDSHRGRSRRGAFLRPLVSAVITLAVISALTFGVSNYKSPEGVARSALGLFATQGQLQRYIEEHGLDRPIYVRYADWLAGALRGDFGTSEITNRSVVDEIGPRFVRSITLAAAALLVALPLSLALGVFMARRELLWSDTTILIATVVIAAMPEFVLGVGLLMLFGVTLAWLPVDSTGLAFGGFENEVEAYVLPTLTLVVAVVPYLARLTRVALREALSAPFVQAAVLRGLSRRTVVWNHAMRNAAVPLVNAVAIAFVNLLSGVVVIENVFAFPGIGQSLVEAVSNGDAVTVQAIVLILGATIIATNLLADLLVTSLNPRLRIQR